jgi:hypothetical protein
MLPLMKTRTTEQRHIPAEMRVRYMKLGGAGFWEKECIEKGIIRFGFHPSGELRKNAYPRNAERFRLCMVGRWDKLRKSYIEDGRTEGVATNFTKQTQLIFQNEPEILWITFIGERLYWGRLESGPPKQDPRDGISRKVVGGWKETDLNGDMLTKNGLPGAVTKLAAFKGTSCDVDVAKYLIQRINGQKIPEVERAVAALKEIELAVLEMIRLLGHKDFEILIELVFSTSGWRRQGVVGKTQKTKDIELTLPSTGERAFVQVKSRTTSKQLDEYVDRIDQLGPYNRMFYVYHTGEAKTDDERVIVWGPEKIAELVVNAGLVNWVMGKVG